MLTLACDSTNKPTPHDYTVQWECFYEQCVYKIFGPSLPSTPFFSSITTATELTNLSTLPNRLSYLFCYFLHLIPVIAHSFRREEYPNLST
jgi:hypothetical protein